ncbi:MAG: hypothetical protein M0Z61_03520 [Nitrospiraceae bacterium]|nr:hypothetical protein [Nitrospiraceae bacterium]
MAKKAARKLLEWHAKYVTELTTIPPAKKYVKYLINIFLTITPNNCDAQLFKNQNLKNNSSLYFGLAHMSATRPGIVGSCNEMQVKIYLSFHAASAAQFNFIGASDI